MTALMIDKRMTAEQIRRISAAIWPTASRPAVPVDEFDHQPELGLDDEAPADFEIVMCTCGEMLARIPRGGGWRSIFDEHLRRCGL